MNERKEHIDLAAGIMLTWMILGHIASHASYDGIFPTIGRYLSFFMPWFFYKAGLFYKEKSFAANLNGGAKKLLVPFVIYSLIGQVFYYVCLITEHNVSFRSFVYQPIRGLFVTECLPGNGALWFLPVLYLIVLIAPFFIKRYHPLLISIIGVAIAFLCYLADKSWFPCIIPNVAGGLAFYALGYFSRDKENQWWMIVTAIVIYAACCIIGYPGIYFHHNTASDTMTYLLYYPASFAGIVLLNNLCKWVNPLIKYSVFRWIGKNSMNLYVTHWIILVLLRLVVLDLLDIQDDAMRFGLYVATMIITLPCLNWLINKIKLQLSHE